MRESRHPQILYASSLRGGELVLLGPKGWVHDPRLAVVAQDAASAAALELRGKDEAARNIVVDVYLVDVEIGGDGTPSPLHYREKSRLAGPSVRPDVWTPRLEEQPPRNIRNDRA